MASIRSRLLWPAMLGFRAWQRRLVRQGPEAIVRFSVRSARMAPAPRLPKGVRRERGLVGGIPGDWLRPEVAGPSKARVMFVHGGGIFFGLTTPHVEVAALIASLTGLPTFAVDHRLMPAHPYPAAHDDTSAAFAALAAEGPVVLVGESSGGVLSLAAMQRARAAGSRQPVLWVGISPTIDYDFDRSPDYAITDDPFNAPEFSALMHREYVAGADLSTPDLSPVAAGLAGMPPMVVHVAEHDLLLGHARRLVATATAAGVPCSSHEWSGIWHGWHLIGFLPEAQQALAELAHEIRRHTAHDAS